MYDANAREYKNYLKVFANPEKIESAKLSEIATAMGILVNKFSKAGALAGSASDIHKALENMDALADIMKNPVPNRNIGDYE